MEIDPTVELLAPVPLDLLEDARLHFGDGEFALGSRAWQVFRAMDDARADRSVRVWLYASHSEQGPAQASATWTGLYLRHVESVGGAHPDGDRYRSPQARLDGDSFWAVYWHVAGLRELEPGEYRPVSTMQGLGQRRPYGHPFEPEGSIQIEPAE